jgi:hypothetical protein
VHWNLCNSFLLEINPDYRPSAVILKANVCEGCGSGVLHKFGYSSRKSGEDTVLVSQSDTGCFSMGSEFIEKERPVSKMD